VLKPNGTIWVTGTHHVIFSVGFAMQQLGFKNVKVYDSSWLGYGNTLDAPANNVTFFNVGLFNSRLSAMQSRIDQLEKELADAGTDPVEGAAAGSETALLERIGVGRHEGYDRVVFQFKNDLPGYRVEYVEPPLKEDGSGRPVSVDGNAIVVVRMEPASGFDLNTGEGVMVYKGPKRIEGASVGASVVQELVRTGDFEAVLSWAIGLSDKVDFRVTTAASPVRLIVDFRNH
jgi:hypothetical protein